MTPAQLYHLKRINAHLARLLDIAAKRTPGEWYENQHKTAIYARHNRNEQVAYTGFPNGDAAFIAATAGNAEAGWMATQIFIKFLLFQVQIAEEFREEFRYAHLLNDLFAAFPLETLTSEKP